MSALRVVISDETHRMLDEAQRRMAEATHLFLEDRPAYSPDIVDSLLELPAFQANYAAFLILAAKTGGMTRHALRGSGPSIDTLPAVGDPQRTAIESLNRLVADLQTHDGGPDVQPVQLDVTTPKSRQQLDLFWFAYDPGVPAEIADAMVGRLESETARMIWWHAPSTWTSEDRVQIVKHRERSFLRYARFVAGIPGSRMTSIPVEDRLRVVEVLERTRRGRENVLAQLPRIVAEIKQ